MAILRQLLPLALWALLTSPVTAQPKTELPKVVLIGDSIRLGYALRVTQKLAGQTRPLPKFALESGEFMQEFLEGTGKLSKA